MVNKTTTSVLLIDDDEEDYIIVRGLLAKIPSKPFELTWINNFKDGTEEIAQQRHDVYLVDYRLGAQNGLELLEQADATSSETPFIVLTGAGDEAIEQRAMRMGASDYLVKGSFDSDLLARVLRYSLQRKHLEMQRIQHLMEVNASKDEFIALASHELRTPASAVKQYLGMLLDGFAGPVPQEYLPFLHTAYDSNERQIKIINDILLVAQLDLKKLTMHKESLDVVDMLKNIIHDVPRLVNRGDALRFTHPDTPIMVDADPGYLRMALSNIAENAAKYTPDDKDISIDISVKEKSVHICVHDQGVGIAPDDMDKLFKKFSRIQNPLSVEVGGTGLGLYWAHEVVKRHRGTVTVESKLGKGSTFTIALPAAS